VSSEIIRINPKTGFQQFRVQQMPAQGSANVNYPITDWSFHAIVRVGVYSNRLYDPSYGKMTQKAAGDARPVELIYEDENVTHHLHVDGNNHVIDENADEKGVLELDFGSI
jgi:hypothetical protein